jgi:hypothetical protein
MIVDTPHAQAPAPLPERARRHALTRALTCALLLTLTLTYTRPYIDISSPNERSRVYAAVALVDHGALSIDAPFKRFGYIGDRATYDGRLYSDKAPGSAALAALVYGVARLWTSAEEWRIHELLWLMRLSLSLPAGLLALLGARALLRRSGLPSPAVDLLGLTYLLGTPAAHYSAAFFGHQLAAAAVAWGLEWGLRAAERGRREGALSCALSGALCGAAVCLEYPSTIAVVTIGATLALTTPPDQRAGRLGAWALGGLPFALALGAYHAACFGHPLSLPYQHLAAPAYRLVHDAGFAGLTAWDPHSFHLWLLSERRGLLVTSPFVLLALLGAWRLSRPRPHASGLLAVTLLGISLSVWFSASAHVWPSDWGFGPRVLLPLLPLWLPAVGAGLGAALSAPWWARALALSLCLYSVALAQLVHAFSPEPWGHSLSPLADVVAPLWRAHLPSPNLGERLGLTGVSALSPLWALLLCGGALTSWRALGALTRRQRLATLTLSALLATAGLSAYARRPPASVERQAEWLKLTRYWSGREGLYVGSPRPLPVQEAP